MFRCQTGFKWAANTKPFCGPLQPSYRSHYSQAMVHEKPYCTAKVECAIWCQCWISPTCQGPMSSKKPSMYRYQPDFKWVANNAKTKPLWHWTGTRSHSCITELPNVQRCCGCRHRGSTTWSRSCTPLKCVNFGGDSKEKSMVGKVLDVGNGVAIFDWYYIYYIVKWQPFDFNVGSPILWLLWHCLYMQCSWKLSSLSQASTTSMSRSNASSLSQYHVNWHVPHDQINDDHGKWPDCHYTATFVCHFCYGSISHQVHNVIAKDTRVMAICCDKRTRCIAVVFSDDLTSRNGTVTSDNVNEPLHLDYVLQCINGSGGWTKGYRGDLWRNTPPGFTIPQWTIKSILMHTAQCSSLRPTDRCAMSS